MNIPEGWKLVPIKMTREMWIAVQGRIDKQAAWRAALAASPTPPAQPSLRLLFDTDIERIALESGFKKKEQPDGRMALNPYVYRFARQIVAASDARPEAERNVYATPSAQEDEPHCPHPCNGRPDDFTMAECILAGECGCTVKGHEYAQSKAQDDEPVAYLSSYYHPDLSKRVYYCSRTIGRARDLIAGMPDQEIKNLYTRPDNSELRKAAEELLNHIRSHLVNHYIPTELQENLRGALNEGEA